MVPGLRRDDGVEECRDTGFRCFLSDIKPYVILGPGARENKVFVGGSDPRIQVNKKRERMRTPIAMIKRNAPLTRRGSIHLDSRVKPENDKEDEERFT